MEQMGLLHLYYGDGKGKTTAAMGLALRALGSGKRVVIVQFLKGGRSGEIPLLEQLGAKVYRGKAGQKFVSQMNEAEKAATRALQDANLAAAMAEPADLLILDEAGSAGAPGRAGVRADGPRACAVDAGRGGLRHRDEVPPPPVPERHCSPAGHRILTFSETEVQILRICNKHRDGVFFALHLAHRCDMISARNHACIF